MKLTRSVTKNAAIGNLSEDAALTSVTACTVGTELELELEDDKITVFVVKELEFISEVEEVINAVELSTSNADVTCGFVVVSEIKLPVGEDNNSDSTAEEDLVLVDKVTASLDVSIITGSEVVASAGNGQYVVYSVTKSLIVTVTTVIPVVTGVV